MRRHMTNTTTTTTTQPTNNGTVPPPMPAHMVQPFPFGHGPDLVFRPAPGFFVQTGAPGPIQIEPVTQVLIGIASWC